MKKVVIGLSGGVDSAVAAYLLKEEGYDVVGLFMINWHETEGTLSGECSWEEDRVFAELTARRLDIPFHVIDLSDHYRKRVVDYMFAEYEKGRTPNPDVLCNREIKFDVFLKEALRLGADYVATGHYCQHKTVENEGQIAHRLLAGVDSNKDQSYFLCQLSQEQLSLALFPVGDIPKPEVRRIATEQHLAPAKRKDSQGICFVGKVDLPVFLQQKLKTKKGTIIEIATDWEGYNVDVNPDDLSLLAEPFAYQPADGQEVGVHDGAHFYTIGQRKGLNIGGKPEPLFVIATDVEKNVIYVGQGKDHKGLMRKALHITSQEMHWVRTDLAMKTGEHPRRYSFRIRYRQPLQEGCLHLTAAGGYIVFDELQRGVTAGQFAVWYDVDELIGSGVIDK